MAGNVVLRVKGNGDGRDLPVELGGQAAPGSLDTPGSRDLTVAEGTNQVQTAQPNLPPEMAAMVMLVERLALNPDVDPDKMQKFLDMQERIIDKGAKTRFDAAFAEMQAHLPIIDEKGQIIVDGKVRSTYAEWADINEAIKPVMQEFGFGLTFRIKVETGLKSVTVVGIIVHRGGHREETEIILPFDDSGAKNMVQKIASSTSYGKRYTGCALLNITTRGEDDDGNQGRKPGAEAGNTKATVPPPGRKSAKQPEPPQADEPRITEHQAANLQALIQEVKANQAEFLKWYGIGKLEELPVRCFTAACEALRNKGKGVQKGGKKR